MSAIIHMAVIDYKEYIVGWGPTVVLSTSAVAGAGLEQYIVLEVPHMATEAPWAKVARHSGTFAWEPTHCLSHNCW